MSYPNLWVTHLLGTYWHHLSKRPYHYVYSTKLIWPPSFYLSCRLPSTIRCTDSMATSPPVERRTSLSLSRCCPAYVLPLWINLWKYVCYRWWCQEYYCFLWMDYLSWWCWHRLLSWACLWSHAWLLLSGMLWYPFITALSSSCHMWSTCASSVLSDDCPLGL